MKVDLFDYQLPPSLIAERPARPRDSARLLDMTGAAFCDRAITDLPDLLGPDDLLVVNDTKVIPCRLDGLREARGAGGGTGPVAVEVTLHKRTGPGCWRAFAKPARRLRAGDEVQFGGGLRGRVTMRDGAEVAFDFDLDDAALLTRLEAVGRMPLPPYIKRRGGAKDTDRDTDRDDYQTLFARREGAVAAPTASLHFTPELLARLEAGGTKRATVTLHVGAGTFLPVTADDTSAHRMHSEWGEVGADAAAKIRKTQETGGRIVAIGTTSLRILEAAGASGVLQPFSGETKLFITPGYRFRVVDLLLTNFHLPRSTLLMLVSALGGRDRVLAAYHHAIAEGYRFYSYGDACLISGQVSDQAGLVRP